MVLDINLFRIEKGYDPQVIRDSQKKRYKNVELVDQIIEYDNLWRTIRFQADQWNKMKGLCGRAFGTKKKQNESEGDSDELPTDFQITLDALNADVIAKLTIKQIRRLSSLIDKEIELTKEKLIKIENDRNSALHELGNLVHKSVPVSDNEVKSR